MSWVQIADRGEISKSRLHSLAADYRCVRVGATQYVWPFVSACRWIFGAYLLTCLLTNSREVRLCTCSTVPQEPQGSDLRLSREGR